MSKIINAKGRIDGNSGYIRVMGHEKLGQLLSRIQATVISNGTELEKIIENKSILIKDLDLFIDNAENGQVENGVYLCLKKIFGKSKKYGKGLEHIKPDMLIFLVQERRVCKVIELKDGDAFDTKKSKGEKENLETFSTTFGSRIPFSTTYYICCFNQECKETIKIGFKNTFDLEHILTGRELCEILQINYDEIILMRKQDSIENLNYFIDSLLKIEDIKELIQNKINNI